MRSFLAILLVLSFATVLTGCGGSNTVDSNLPVETGSNSLVVIAEVEGTDAGPGLFTTQFKVTLLDSLNAPVTDATVSITRSTLGATSLTWDTLTASDYTASVSGYYPGNYTLNIQRGTDYLANGRVYAPDIHIITYPRTSIIIPINTSMTVEWTRNSEANFVKVETRDYGPVLSTALGDTDDGSIVIPGSSKIRNNQRVQVTRSNDVTLTKGLAGSSFIVSIRNSVFPVIQDSISISQS